MAPDRTVPGVGSPREYVRRRPVPARTLGQTVIVARPTDGGPVVLPPTASTVWSSIESWASVEDVDRVLASRFPDVDADERLASLTQVLGTLEDEGLLERR